MAWDREIALGLDLLLKDPVDVWCSQKYDRYVADEERSTVLCFWEVQVAQT